MYMHICAFLFRNKHVYNYIYKYVHAYMRVYPIYDMFLFRNKHVYNYIYKYVHAYMRVYPYSQKCRIKIKSWRRLQLLWLWSLYMLPTPKDLQHQKPRELLSAKTWKKFGPLDMAQSNKKMTFFDGLIFVTIQICLRTGLVTFGNQVVCRPRNSAALSYPHLLGGSTVSNLRKKKTWSFSNGGEPPYIFPSISKVVTWQPQNLWWESLWSCIILPTYGHATFRLGDGIYTWFTHLGVSINSWIGGSAHGLGQNLPPSIAWEKNRI